MKLKKLILSGFKSFADRTEFEFDRGVSCVVGPNGCGKSNIVDAIKWVLGEQSAKSLRGSEMQDVIFNGSAARRAAGLAEVTLVFDNHDGLLRVAVGSDAPHVHPRKPAYGIDCYNVRDILHRKDSMIVPFCNHQNTIPSGDMLGDKPDNVRFDSLEFREDYNISLALLRESIKQYISCNIPVIHQDLTKVFSCFPLHTKGLLQLLRAEDSPFYEKLSEFLSLHRASFTDLTHPDDRSPEYA